MADNDKSKKLSLIDLVGISKLLDTLVEQEDLPRAECDKVAQRILSDTFLKAKTTRFLNP